VRLAIAGHPPPVLAVPGEPAVLLDVDTGLPLGAPAEEHHASTVVPMAPGAVLLLYTDGLVERRTEPLDVGFDRLLATVVPDRPDAVCRRVIRGLIGDDLPSDDVAVFAARRTPNGAGS
jgi:sigma-B regulation protein RsbU (phosphoserine phosphatase)